MRAAYFRYGTNSKGMVVLAGLSPEETFELEHLLYQNEHNRSAADQARLDKLCEKHCRAVHAAEHQKT